MNVYRVQEGELSLDQQVINLLEAYYDNTMEKAKEGRAPLAFSFRAGHIHNTIERFRKKLR